MERGSMLIFSGFIRDNPRQSALSAFYQCVLCREHRLLTTFTRVKTDLNYPQIRDGKIEWPEGFQTFRPFFFQGCDFTNEWSG
jgi:hypothetical protein